jgi:hypothetical protein
MSGEFKDETTARLRGLVLTRGGVVETESAEAGLTTLSFTSKKDTRRSVWIDTDLKGQIVIDLEDNEFQGEYDHSVAHVVPKDIPMAVEVIEAWLDGADLDRCLILAPAKK